MASLLGALLRNESGGRNIPNVHQGTSSGQAQGYFQITTGTWKEFAQRAGIDLDQYPNPMAAPYDVQAQVASTIPLRRWDKSTLAAMSGTGKPIDPNRTLGENLSMNGESFGGSPDIKNVARNELSTQMATRSSSAGGPGGGTPTGENYSAANMAGPTPQPTYSSSGGGPGGGTRTGQPASGPDTVTAPTDTAAAGSTLLPPPPAAGSNLAGTQDPLGTSLANIAGAGDQFKLKPSIQYEAPASIGQVIPGGNLAQAQMQRQNLAQALARLNQRRIWGGMV